MSELQTVLMIDDDGDILAAAGIRLAATGFQVLSARDERTGLELAIERRPAVILLDLHLNATDGLETLVTLLQLQNTAEIPVVVFSADREATRRALTIGAYGYVNKPYECRALVETIRRSVVESTKRRRHAIKPEIHKQEAVLHRNLGSIQQTLASFTTRLGRCKQHPSHAPATHSPPERSKRHQPLVENHE